MTSLRCCISLVLVFAASAACAEGIKLESREYKLMLKPENFVGLPSDGTANELWGKLKTIIGGRADVSGRFGVAPPRTVQFFDIAGCQLDKHGYALRLRSESGDDPKLTLKFRSPDLLLVAATDIDGNDNRDGDTKFEEDITPLRVHAGGKAIAEAGSMRSLFSRSTEKKPRDMNRLGDVFARFDTMEANLKALGAATAKPGAELRPGVTLHEFVFRGPEAVLEGTKAKFSLTLWHDDPPKNDSGPIAAEISFTFHVKDELTKAGASSRIGSELFKEFQMLGEWVDLTLPPKTTIGLSKVCPGN
jgi:hypothetical protein